MPEKASARTRKGAGQPPAPDASLAVRMLVGPRAGEIVRVTRDEAARLCDGWQPQAELVAVREVDARETR